MSGFAKSLQAYEAWLDRQLGRQVVKADIGRKHAKMGASPFVFLRGTYWRWAETILEVCPDLAGAADVLAVGDIHLENFGTWRDGDGRLVWGVNDFDEAARMPYALDLVRLAASGVLASQNGSISAATICRAVLEGYRLGLGAPQAIVLDRDWAWLRELLVVSDRQRERFWSKIEATRRAPAPPRYRRALAAAMPERGLKMWTARRVAGTGSLGRPRWIGVADWQGAPVVREAKAALPSGWELARGRSGRVIRCAELAGGRYRARDPWYRVEEGMILRRLSPNNRKVEAEKEGVSLLTHDMLHAMGLELANVHLGAGDRRDAILRDLASRKAGWLLADAKRAAAAVAAEFRGVEGAVAAAGYAFG